MKTIFSTTYKCYPVGIRFNRFDIKPSFGMPSRKGWHFTVILPIVIRKYSRLYFQIRHDEVTQ